MVGANVPGTAVCGGVASSVRRHAMNEQSRPQNRPQNRPLGVVARRVGYAAAVVVHMVLLFLLNVRPGWQVASFLTEDTPQVLVLLNLSLLAGVVANIVYVLADGPWVKTV